MLHISGEMFFKTNVSHNCLFSVVCTEAQKEENIMTAHVDSCSMLTLVHQMAAFMLNTVHGPLDKYEMI